MLEEWPPVLVRSLSVPASDESNQAVSPIALGSVCSRAVSNMVLSSGTTVFQETYERMTKDPTALL